MTKRKKIKKDGKQRNENKIIVKRINKKKNLLYSKKSTSTNK